MLDEDGRHSSDERAQVVARLAALQRLKLQLEKSTGTAALCTIEQMMQAEFDTLQRLGDRNPESA
jgi:hypothetical protein